MLFYYAYTGHKIGLDRVKKAAAIIKELESEGVACRLLVNDFRAGLAARDYGIPDSITIETIQDIDAIAEMGNDVIIDSPEDDHGRLEKYCREFNQVFRYAQHGHDSSRFGEVMLGGAVVDRSYEAARERKREKRRLFFLNDADYDKILLGNAALFEKRELELLLGHYFFVKYEDALAKIFRTLHEPEEYMELIQSASHVVTASVQCALEAGTSGACVYFLNLLQSTEEELQLLHTNGIPLLQNGIDGIDFDTDCSVTVHNQRDEIVRNILQNL
jgi:hypothetical protein